MRISDHCGGVLTIIIILGRPARGEVEKREKRISVSSRTLKGIVMIYAAAVCHQFLTQGEKMVLWREQTVDHAGSSMAMA